MCNLLSTQTSKLWIVLDCLDTTSRGPIFLYFSNCLLCTNYTSFFLFLIRSFSSLLMEIFSVSSESFRCCYSLCCTAETNYSGWFTSASLFSDRELQLTVCVNTRFTCWSTKHMVIVKYRPLLHSFSSSAITCVQDFILF